MSLAVNFWRDWPMDLFGKNLARLRKQRKLTQQQLADLLDVQQRLIGRWETGEGKPQFDYLVKLADVLEVNIDDLIRGSASNETPDFAIKNKRLQELSKRIDALSKEDQDAVCYLMECVIRKESIRKLALESVF